VSVTYLFKDDPRGSKEIFCAASRLVGRSYVKGVLCRMEERCNTAANLCSCLHPSFVGDLLSKVRNTLNSGILGLFPINGVCGYLNAKETYLIP
jgi:hypothetical protein